jgi:hypothetical protein
MAPHTEVLTAQVAAIKTADKAGLTFLYTELIGYDPFADDEANTPESVRGDLLDYCREMCFAAGLHCSDVGLND